MSQFKHRAYSDEQRVNAVRLIRKTSKRCKLAHDFEMTAYTLHRWVKQATIDAGKGRVGSEISPLCDACSALSLGAASR